MRLLTKIQALDWRKMGLGLFVALIFALPMMSNNLYAKQNSNTKSNLEPHKTCLAQRVITSPCTVNYVARIKTAGGAYKNVSYTITLYPVGARGNQSSPFVSIAVGTQVVYAGPMQAFRNLIDSYLFYGAQGRGFGVNLIALARLANLVDSHAPSLSLRFVRNVVVNRIP